MFQEISPSVVNFDSDDDATSLKLKFNNTLYFNQFNFEYLAHPIVYKFKQCVGLKNQKYNIQILGIQTEDAAIVTKIIRRLHSGMRLRKNLMYVTNKHAVFEYADGGIWIPNSLDNKEFLIELAIEGYKTNENGFPTPIWSISRAVQVFDSL